MLKAIKNNIPNAITCMNLLSGCVACIFAFKGDYTMVTIAIAAAAVFDFFDGFAARLLHSKSNLGKELDSLSDLISFGLAPAMLMYNTMVANGVGVLSYGALALPVAGALRLAKFNLDDSQVSSFLGLPIPANAIFWLGFSAWIHEYQMINEYVILAFVALLCYLMVSNIPMFSFKFKNYRISDNFARYVLILGSVMFLIFQGLSGLAWSVILYVCLSFVSRSSVSEQD